MAESLTIMERGKVIVAKIGSLESDRIRQDGGGQTTDFQMIGRGVAPSSPWPA